MKKPLTLTLTLYVIAALILGGSWLWLTTTGIPTDTPIMATPVATASLQPPPMIATPIPTAPPAVLASPTIYPSTTPMLLAESTPRPTSAVRNRFVRCDNPYIWSLPVNDTQLRLNANFGIQSVGSVYYEGLLALKLITPLPTLMSSPTVLATDTPNPISPTPDLSATITMTPGVFHPGVDLHTGEDAPVYAVANGVVALVSYSDVYGLYAIIDVPGYQVLYGHLNELLVEGGQQVNCGQLIGLSGATGTYQTGPHLHFEVRQRGEAIDPLPLLQRAARAKLPTDLQAGRQ